MRVRTSNVGRELPQAFSFAFVGVDLHPESLVDDVRVALTEGR